MKHPKTIKKYSGNLKELSRDILNLDYDALVELFECLKGDFKLDSDKEDQALDHPQVANKLKNISEGLYKLLKEEIEPMAKICRSYNEKGIR